MNGSIRKKVSRYSLHPSTPVLGTVREFVKTTLKPFPGVEPHLFDIVAATHEACKNSVVHNPCCDGPVEVVCELLDDSVVIEVSDRGGGFDPALLPPSAPDPGSSAGRGLLIIYSLMDEVDASTGVDGTRIRMRKLTGLA